ncbi:MAG: F0F1 ATP synthase subunit B [Bacteroidales bacterium]|jgi:F-type H+-transporting ATPase subunit b|nr:F0F1 ATP synthase subunit B [Bacteroidales bacterium]HBG88231.1 ATP synthase F0 subunit B [Marinilabiliaceae bacterium]
MGILTPDPGLVFWTSLSFITLLLIMKRYAWKPILRSLKLREERITFSLRDAELAREEMVKMEETRRQMMEKARLERDGLIREARALKDEIVQEAKLAAQNEASKIMEKAREQINRERKAAIADIRNQVGLLSLDIAEKILREEMHSAEKQQSVMEKYLKNVEFN